METMQKLTFTGERYLPWVREPRISYEHLHRYSYASHFARGKRVLDLASGEGYGASQLAKTAESVVGVDIDQGAVSHATETYQSPNLRFIEGSITDIPIQSERFDVITCFEAIEHVEDHEGLMREVTRLLEPDGVFIVSTPNKAQYSDNKNYHNHFHVKELYLEEFQALLKSNFSHSRIGGQRIYSGSRIWPLEQSTNRDISFVVVREMGRFIHQDFKDQNPEYYIAVASNAPLTDIPNSSLLDASDAVERDYLKQLEEKQRELLETQHQLQQAETNLQQTFKKTGAHEQHLLADIKILQKEVRSRQQELQQYNSSRIVRAALWLRNLFVR